MKTLTDILVEAQTLVVDIQALVDAPAVTPAPVVAPTDTEVDILLSDGTTKKFVPAPEVTA